MNRRLFPAQAVWLTAAIVSAMLSASPARARVVADGDNGVLYVNGALIQGACNISTDSRWQTLDMGSISNGELAWPGQRAPGRAFHLHLQDCISHGIAEEAKETGEIVRVTDEPEARISFISEVDVNNPQLIAVRGADGFGLRLEDAEHHPVSINGRGEPSGLQEGNDELTFWLVPERTRAVMHEGAWRSVINMRLSYE